MTQEFHVDEKVGPYRIVRPLGQGGMGTVYEVVHEKLGVHYALKAFTLESGHKDLFRKRFLAEGRVLARIRHPNIVRVFDLDADEARGVVYFVMDLVHYRDGESHALSDLSPGAVGDEKLREWFTQLASALDYIHGLGVVHRDIKLDNILRDEGGGVVLGDFGIARFVGEEIRSAVEVTRTTLVEDGRQDVRKLIVGTAGYMAPEIRRGEAASVASDTYALGVVFFRQLTGMWYEPGSSAFQLLEPLDGEWKEILPRMLDEDPAKRPTKLAPLAEALSKKRPVAGAWRKELLWIVSVFVIALMGALGVMTTRDGANVKAVSAASEKVELEIADGVVMEFVRCPARMFEMSNVPNGEDGAGTHTVTLTRDFWIATELVATNQFRRLGLDGIEAQIAEWNRRCGAQLPPKTVLRLPTESEWESAMQAGLFTPDYGFEATADTVKGRYLKKYAWKSELDALVYALRETDTHRKAVETPAWVCRQNQYRRLLLRPDNRDVRVRLVIGPALP